MIGIRPPQPAQLCPEDLQLLHHFTTDTYCSLSDVSHIQRTYQVAVPREALAHDYLMHSVLALAAVHLSLRVPLDKAPFERAALMHRNLALRLAIPSLSNITSTNAHALFAFSGMVAVLSLVFPQLPETGLPPSPIETFLNFLRLVRGVHTIVRGGLHWIDQGDMRPLLRPDGMKNVAKWMVKGEIVPVNNCEEKNATILTLPDQLLVVFGRLLEWNAALTTDSNYRELYASTINDLRKLYETVALISKERSLAFVWAVLLQQPFLEQLEKREPMALVILAHWCVLIHSTGHPWWATRLWEQLVENIHRELDPKWHPAVAWAQDAVKTGIWTYWFDAIGKMHRTPSQSGLKRSSTGQRVLDESATQPAHITPHRI